MSMKSTASAPNNEALSDAELESINGGFVNVRNRIVGHGIEETIGMTTRGPLGSTSPEVISALSLNRK